MRISRKTKNLLKTILSVVLAVGMLFGVATLINHISNKADEELVEINPSFEVGGLTEYGKYEDTKLSIYTKDSFECIGLQISLEFDSNVKYQVFFYDETDNFLSSSVVYEEGSTPSIPNNAKKARLEVTPIWDSEVEEEDKELNIFKVRKYAKQLTIKVSKEQGEYVMEFKELDLTDETLFTQQSGYYSADGTHSADSTYNSYLFVATEYSKFYMESSLSTCQYVIIKTDGTAIRYQKANGTWVEGEENTFELNVGDKVAISTTSSSTDNIHFYLGTNVLK